MTDYDFCDMTNYDLCNNTVGVLAEAKTIVFCEGHKAQLESWINKLEGEMRFPFPQIRLPSEVVGEIFTTVLATSPENFIVLRDGADTEEFCSRSDDPVWIVCVPSFIPEEWIQDYLQRYFYIQ